MMVERKRSERCALAALIALVIYGLACFYPVAWSPDSDRVVFPVFGEGSIQALVISGLSGKPIREVARVAPEKASLSPAAWSPDGKWIAYMKFGAKAPAPGEPVPSLGDAEAVDCSLILQDAESGDDRTISVREVSSEDEEVYLADFSCGPQWAADSETLAVRSMCEDPPGLVVLNTEGNLLREVKLEGGLPLMTAAISPDGRYVSYVEKVEEGEGENLAVRLHDFETGTTRQIAVTAGDDDKVPRPAWSPGSECVYFAGVQEGENGEAAGLVERHTIETGDTTSVWSKPEAGVVGISVSSGTGRLAVDFLRDEDFAGIEVLDPVSGGVTPIHFGRTHYSTAISPDGKWVAFCPGTELNEESLLGAIVSSDGAQLRFFLPAPESAAAVPEIVTMRLKCAWEETGLAERVENEFEERAAELGLDPDEMTTAEQRATAFGLLDGIIEGETHAIFREAAEYMTLAEFIEDVDLLPDEELPRLVALLRERVNRFLESHPDHPLVPGLKERLDKLLEDQETEVEVPSGAAE